MSLHFELSHYVRSWMLPKLDKQEDKNVNLIRKERKKNWGREKIGIREGRDLELINGEKI